MITRTEFNHIVDLYNEAVDNNRIKNAIGYLDLLDEEFNKQVSGFNYGFTRGYSFPELGSTGVAKISPRDRIYYERILTEKVDTTEIFTNLWGKYFDYLESRK